MSRIHLNIEKVVLNGIEPANRAALMEGLRAELTRALSNPATRAQWARSHRTPIIKLGAMPMDPGPAGGRKFGGQVGRAIGKGLAP